MDDEQSHFLIQKRELFKAPVFIFKDIRTELIISFTLIQIKKK